MPFFRWKLWKRIILAVAGLAMAAWVVYIYYSWISDNNLRDAIEEADRLDPGWRLEELLAKREAIPDAENGALCVQATIDLLPTNWPSLQHSRTAGNEEANDSLEASIFDLSPELQVNEEQLEYLKKECERAAAALRKARELCRLPRGRYQVNWSSEVVSLTSQRQRARQIANLLHYDAVLLAQENKADAALENAIGVLNAGRSIGDEPDIISQLVRMGPQSLAVRSMERVLAQGQPSPEALQSAQRLLQDEAAQPLLLVGARGERARVFLQMEGIKTGDVKLTSAGPTELEDLGQNLGGSLYVRFNEAPLLQVATKFVEIAKLPPEEQLSQLKALQETQTNPPVSVRLLLPAYEKFAQGCVRCQANLRCAYVGLAVERYRLGHGHWPNALADVVPEFLQRLPCDPYNGKPLHYIRTKDGVVIYSVGPDGNDDGGKLDRKNPTAAGTDLGFQLWDVSRRRQPWRPTKPPEDQDQ